LKTVEANTGKRFGDDDNPLLVSCRSGAKFSMPGMMDTVLNIGLNRQTVAAMIRLTDDPRFVYDAYRRIDPDVRQRRHGNRRRTVRGGHHSRPQGAGVENDTELTADDWQQWWPQFKAIYRRHTTHDFPEDPYKQLKMATEAVFKSWNGKRAVDYRTAAGISHDLGTAVSVVTMVFGNMGDDCATGVAMTRNGSTGEPHLEGDYLTNAQGEDVVAGIRMTKDLSI
jgi:pyruvate,orthophosphate dikinase